MTARRYSPALIAAALLTALLIFFSGCGADGSGNDAVIIEPEAAAQTIVDGVEFRDTLVQAEGEAAKSQYRLDDANIESYAIWISGSGATAEEVAVLKVADSADLAAARAVVDQRIEELKFRYESYVPKEMVKLEDPLIVERNDVVILVLSDDSDAARTVVDGLFD